MLKNHSHTPIDINNSLSASLDEIKQFTFPKLRENKNAWYIEFYAYDPLYKKMRRKRIKINRIKSIKASVASGFDVLVSFTSKPEIK